MLKARDFILYQSKYFYLLLVLLAYYLLISVLSDKTMDFLPISMMFAVMTIVCVYVLMREKLLVFYIVTLAVASLGCHFAIDYGMKAVEAYVIYYTADVMFLTIGSFAAIYSVAKHDDVTADTLCGAICGYMLIGTTWCFIYLLIDTVNPHAFSKVLAAPSLHESFLNATYFSFTTITTLGYGDLLPVSQIARTCSWLEAVSGQIYLATWISQLVGLRIAQRRR